jgi:predicted acylesterase/phospholipase RssA
VRLFSNLPLEKLQKLPPPQPPLDQVWQQLMERAQAGKFPVYINTEGDPTRPSATDSIATESLASIAQRENTLGADFPDPRDYYRWLVTRVHSNHEKVDPWLYVVSPQVHAAVETVKHELTPPWLTGRNQDPMGLMPDPKQSQDAYRKLIGLAGNGERPTFQNLADFADAVVGLDRDLLTGVQTYWVKMLREVSPEQRSSLLAPLAKAWVSLNLLAPNDPQFNLVSPDNAPMIDLIDRSSGQPIQERYDRSMALREAVEHSLDSLGIDEREQFRNLLTHEIQACKPAIEAREARLKATLSGYRGIDVDRVLSGQIDASDPAVDAQLQVLQRGEYGANTRHPMNARYAESLRHFGLLDWMTHRTERYGDVNFGLSFRHADFGQHPLIVSEFYTPPQTPGMSTRDIQLAAGPSRQMILGQPVAGQAPVKMSIVLEGGGGKGFAYPECLSQMAKAIDQGQGQIAIDEFVGTSAGAITAGILAGGFGLDELSGAMQQMDFKKFYSDYMWLEGGVDPKVRGVNREGLFSEQGMYQGLYKLLGDKLGIQGRPILFRDLPYKLKVCSTVLDTNVPADLKNQFNIGADGHIVFSSEATPNMDVVAAICASAAVPAFFNSPQIRISRGDGQLYRMQLMDGGTVDNFPVAAACQDEKSMLVALPAYDENQGSPAAELSTLDFDPAHLGPINDYNDQRYAQFAPQVARLAQAARQQGVGRVVLGMHLSAPAEQPAPIVQGPTAAETDSLLQLADQVKLPHMSAADGRQLIRQQYPSQSSLPLEQMAVKDLLDDGHVFVPGGQHRNPQYHPPTQEMQGIPDMMLGVVAATLTAPSQIDKKLFEQQG